MHRAKRAARREAARLGPREMPESRFRFLLLTFGLMGVLGLGFAWGAGQRNAMKPAPTQSQDLPEAARYDPNVLVRKLATTTSPEEQARLLKQLTQGGYQQVPQLPSYARGASTRNVPGIPAPRPLQPQRHSPRIPSHGVKEVAGLSQPEIDLNKVFYDRHD